MRGKRGSGLQGLRRNAVVRVTVDEPLTPIDRLTPIGNDGTPITGKASEVSIGDAAFTSETLHRSSVFFFAVAV